MLFWVVTRKILIGCGQLAWALFLLPGEIDGCLGVISIGRLRYAVESCVNTDLRSWI
jgi:hypothetical protein